MNKNSEDATKAGPDRRRVSIRSVRRSQPDERKLARALIAIVQAQAEAEAQAAHLAAEESGSEEVA